MPQHSGTFPLVAYSGESTGIRLFLKKKIFVTGQVLEHVLRVQARAQVIKSLRYYVRGTRMGIVVDAA